MRSDKDAVTGSIDLFNGDIKFLSLGEVTTILWSVEYSESQTESCYDLSVIINFSP